MKATGKTLADRLKSRRKELGLSQNALANSCGVSQPTIANWERGGHVPRQDALTSIALGLDVDPIWLLSGVLPLDKSPAHQHLSKPIRNIPIFVWPDHINELNTARAQDYITISAMGDDLLALTAPTDSDFSSGTILIFDMSDAVPRKNGRYLVDAGETAKIMNLEMAANDINAMEATHPIGRLILSIQSH